MRNNRHEAASSALIACQDRWFVVEQCRSCPLPGYLVVRSTSLASDLGTLSVDAAAHLGPLLRRVVRAIHGALHPIRVYVAQFGEQERHCHFHVLPRTEALTRAYLADYPDQAHLIHGPMLLDWARERYRDQHASDETIRVFRELRDRLTAGKANKALPPAALPRIRGRRVSANVRPPSSDEP